MSDNLITQMFNNETLTGQALTEFTTYVSGDYFITLFLIFAFIILLGVIFRFPIEWLSIVLVPISIYFMAVDSRFYVVGGVIIFYVGMIFFKNFWFDIK